MSVPQALVALLFAVGALAHGNVNTWVVDGKDYNGIRVFSSPDGQSSIERYSKTFEPISDWNSPHIACNDNGKTNPGQKTAPIDAGKRINTKWSKWPHDTGSLTAYLGKCTNNNCTSTNVNEIDWFKIAEEGLLDGVTARGYWAAKKMMDNNSEWAFDIPKGTPTGQYMVRVETIALHVQPAQAYMYCAQLDVQNGGGVEPSSDQLVKFPGAYGASDPGIKVNIWDGWDNNNPEHHKYVIPGPPLYTGEGAPSAPTPSEPEKPADPEPTTPAEEPTYPQPTKPSCKNKKKKAPYGSAGWRKKMRMAKRDALVQRAQRKAKRALEESA